jgi:glutamate-1-semialdehyde 2,1-aminomutase
MILLNEQYLKVKNFIDKGIGDKLFYGKKKLLDLSFNSGVLILGHGSITFKKVLKNFITKNISIYGHPNVYAKKLAEKINFFFPRFNKIIFSSSGSESVNRALRIAKALNNKNLIISVTGSWHGSSDQTLFIADKNLKPTPLTAGLSKDRKKNIMFIPYNDIQKSKEILDKNKKKINCLIIEPVQGCLPIENPKPYLKFLEQYCKNNNIILIFDEIITGFRTKHGSVQKKYKIKADITILGKILGGGFPIGAIGITSVIANKIKKLNTNIVYGGTFSANSFSTYSGLKTISHLIKNKNIINNIIKKSEYFQKKINNFIKVNNLDISVYRFDSLLRVVFTKKKVNNRMQRDFLELNKKKNIIYFRKYLWKNGIHYPSNGIIFFSDSSKIKNIDLIIDTFNQGLIKYFSKK